MATCFRTWTPLGGGWLLRGTARFTQALPAHRAAGLFAFAALDLAACVPKQFVREAGVHLDWH